MFMIFHTLNVIFSVCREINKKKNYYFKNECVVNNVECSKFCMITFHVDEFTID